MAKRAKPLTRVRNQQAQAIQARYAEVAGSPDRIPLNQISNRVLGDTRPLNPTHINELKESIAVLGLISPLAIDETGALLAGGHRRAALQRLYDEAPTVFHTHFSSGIPVHKIAIDSATDTIEALQIEIEENTQRKNYTAEEIRAAAAKLESAGYERLRGRPTQGQKSLKRALQNVFRLSETRIRQILNDYDTVKNELSISTDYKRALNGLKRLTKKAKKSQLTPQELKIYGMLESLIHEIELLK